MDYAKPLATDWRERAAQLRRYGAEPSAVTLEQCAAELEAADTAWGDELLTPAEAAAHSGYSDRRIRELAKAGRLKNYGSRYAPQYRRSELPMKPGHAERTAEAEAIAARFRKAS